ncbi:MAG: YdeI/OmpD-associated family protein [Pseudoxanthomonas sp.]|nr:YdeI/OmpD-associated family protein [Pseudoxanthomonas sp.]
MASPDLPIEHFADPAAWERWLERHPQSSGVWLKIAKKDTGIPSVTYPEALDVALCHGWIDGQKKGFDAQFFLQRFTPRRARSTWSKINVAKIDTWSAAGRMRPAGLREVEAAKADGRWDAAYDGARSMDVPPELAKALALARNRKAKAFFDTLDKTNRYAVCWRV